jgi:hypothetical protein
VTASDRKRPLETVFPNSKSSPNIRPLLKENAAYRLPFALKTRYSPEKKKKNNIFARKLYIL